jgi:histidyl-tRNA synthetase
MNMPTKTAPVKKIEPISGFPEFTPAQQRAFDAIRERIAKVYASFGYTPLETAAVERTEILIAKGIDAKEVYGLRRLAAAQGAGDDDTTGAKDVALRFDLTVPTARYVAQHFSQLVFPFRRQQIQPVWRGERPQKGRYRQFYQCDIDYISQGAGSLPLAADAEILACAYTALKALGLRFTMKINNRKALKGILDICGFTSDEQQYRAIKVIDDYEKIARADFYSRLQAVNAAADVEGLASFLETKLPPKHLLARYDSHALCQEGMGELMTVLAMAQQIAGISEEKNAGMTIDLKIARGLDYYTGTVVETVLHDAPELGSICSGGRYDNLAESLSERALPGVGISIGLGRLGMWMVEREPWNRFAATPADVFVPHVDGFDAAPLVAGLRAAGIAVEQGLEALPLGKQLITADARGHHCAVIAGDATQGYTLRTFAPRQDYPGLLLADLVTDIERLRT